MRMSSVKILSTIILFFWVTYFNIKGHDIIYADTMAIQFQDGTSLFRKPKSFTERLQDVFSPATSPVPDKRGFFGRLKDEFFPDPSPIKIMFDKSEPTVTPTPTATPTPTPTPNFMPTPMFQGQLGRNPETEKVSVDPVVIRAITKAAKQYRLPPELLYDVAYGESSLNPNPSEVTDQYGNVHKGLFQFDQPTWETARSYSNMPGSSLVMPKSDYTDPEAAALVAAYLIKQGQLGKWNASEPSWGPYYSSEEVLPYYKQTKDFIPKRFRT